MQSAEPLRVGLVRVGVGASQLLRALTTSPHIQLIAAADVRPAALERMGEAGVLGVEMERIERRAARVIRLNPLLGNSDYRPMRAALAHVSVFASAHNLQSLQALGRALTL